MKKTLVLLFVLTIFNISNAQFLRGYGIKAGGTMANQVWDYSNDLNFDPDNKLGLNVGVFAEFIDLTSFSVVGEFNYVQKNSEWTGNVSTVENPDGNGTIQTIDVGNDYLNLSLLAKLRFDFVVVAPYVVAGPKLDFDVAGSNEVLSDYKKTIPGIKFGAGTEVDLKVIRLLAEFIYDYNMNSLYENENLKLTSNSFDFRLGIYL